MTLEEALRKAHNQVCLTCSRHLGGMCGDCKGAHAAVDLVAKVAALEQADMDIRRFYEGGDAKGAEAQLLAERERLRREAGK